jgi:hypothetical protein
MKTERAPFKIGKKYKINNQGPYHGQICVAVDNKCDWDAPDDFTYVLEGDFGCSSRMAFYGGLVVAEEITMKTKEEYRKIADRKWGKDAEWITGRGRFAVLAFCRCITITLWTELEKAKLAKKQIDETACGGMCHGAHMILDLENGKEVQ